MSEEEKVRTAPRFPCGWERQSKSMKAREGLSNLPRRRGESRPSQSGGQKRKEDRSTNPDDSISKPWAMRGGTQSYKRKGIEEVPLRQDQFHPLERKVRISLLLGTVVGKRTTIENHAHRDHQIPKKLDNKNNGVKIYRYEGAGRGAELFSGRS